MVEDKKTMTREEMMADIMQHRDLKAGLKNECDALETEYKELAKQKGLDLNGKDSVDIGEE